MVAALRPRTCAWCGERDSVGLDGDNYPICDRCGSIVDPSSVRAPSQSDSLSASALKVAMRWDGCTVGDVCTALGVESEADQNAISVALRRAVASGYLRTSGKAHSGFAYHPTGNRTDADSRMIGKRYGSLVVVERAGESRYAGAVQAKFLVKCDCGQTKIIRAADIRRGRTRSCGCSKRKRLDSVTGSGAG